MKKGIEVSLTGQGKQKRRNIRRWGHCGPVRPETEVDKIEKVWRERARDTCDSFHRLQTENLKVPKCEIFDPFFFTPINPLWVGDLRTG